jgi:hypothetical protein
MSLQDPNIVNPARKKRVDTNPKTPPGFFKE